MNKQNLIPLNPQESALNHAHMYVSYDPKHIEADGISISGWVLRIHTSLGLTYAETLALVNALRQIPAIEQATAPQVVCNPEQDKLPTTQPQ